MKGLAMSQSGQEIRGVVLPGAPVFDKLCAFALLEMVRGQEFTEDDIEFFGNQYPEPDDFRRWQATGRVVVDVGTQKYQARDDVAYGREAPKTSATHWVAEDFGLMSDPVVAKLVDTCTRNNNLGDLRDMGNRSIVYLLRELYSIVDDEDRQIRHPFDVLSLAVPVIKAWIRARRLAADTAAQEPLWLADLLGQLGGDRRAWTIGGYLCDLVSTGASEADVRASLKTWLDVRCQVIAFLDFIQDEGHRVLQDTDHVEFLNGRAVEIHTKFTPIARFMLKRDEERSRQAPFLLVMAVKQGNVAILTRGGTNFDLAWLASELQKRPGESDIWVYVKRKSGSCVLNGGLGRKAEPTKLPLAGIRRLIVDAYYRGQRQQKQQPRNAR